MIESKLKKSRNVVANCMEINGREVVYNVNDIEKEYKALREGAMFYDCSNYGILKISGNSAADFLEHLSTKDIQYLNIGNASECYFLNANADVVGSVVILCRNEDYLVITPWEQADAVKAWVEEKATGEAVEVQDLLDEKALIQIEGPESWKVVKDVFGIEIENLALRAFDVVNWNGEEVIILRIGRSSEYGYMVISSFEKANEVCNTLLNSAWNFPVLEGGFEVVELAMLEIHQPNFIKETPNYGNIFELAQQWNIQFDKEDYIGYEKLMELFNKGINKTAVGFVCDMDISIQEGESIYVDDDYIGNVVYIRDSIKLEKKLGIAVLQKPYAVSGLRLKVDTSEGKRDINTVSGPFVRPISWDKKME